MKRFFPLFPALLFCFSLQISAQSADSCGCFNCPNFMPDNFVGQFYFQVNNAVHNDLADSVQGVCGVRVHFDHEYLGDMQISLVSPAGQVVTLMGPVGFFGMTDFTDWNVLFVPCGAVALPDPGFLSQWSNNQSWGMSSLYTGSYYPSNGCLQQFDSGPVNGQWSLVISDNQAIDVGNLYDFEVLFCDTTGILCSPAVQFPQALFQAATSEWFVTLNNNSTNAQSYELDFGDGTSYTGSTFPNFHTYADTGTYLVQLIAINQFGADTFAKTIYVAGAIPTVSQVSATGGNGCAPLQTEFTALFPDHVDSYHWLFPGATPAESFNMVPQVTYDVPGVYPVTLLLSNVVGTNEYVFPDYIHVEGPLLAPGFFVQVLGNSLVATNTSLDYTQFYWLLDGVPVIPSTVQQAFAVDSSGVYVVALFIANNCDSASLQVSVPVVLSGIQDPAADDLKLLLLPNPNDGSCRLELSSPETLPAQLSVMNAAGQVVYTQKTSLAAGENTLQLHFADLTAGLYLLRLQTEKGGQSVKFILER